MTSMPIHKYRPFPTIELPDRRFVLGVQWHPEADETSHVVGALVAEAERHMRERVEQETAA